MAGAVPENGLAAAARDLATLEAEIEAAEAATLARWGDRIARPGFRAAAANLAGYLALRARDRTDLQRRLRALGLSSLGRSEGCVLSSIRAVRATAEHRDPDPETAAGFAAARRDLEAASAAALGPAPLGRRTRIMATLSPEITADPARLAAIICLGVDAARINCAHDGPEDWRAMAAAARAAAASCGRGLRLYMDLAGPKIRTAAIRPRPGVRVRAGDRLRLLFDADAPEEAVEGAGGPVRAACACTLPEAARQVGEGDAVAFDDGKIEGRVVARDAFGLTLEIARAKPGGARLKPDKGINFPGAALSVDPLTGADHAALDVIAREADMVGHSFVQRPEDAAALLDALAERGAAPAVIAKVETGTAFRNLPEIVATAAGRGPFGVMIARGDLAVEIGFARLSEVQEEILWLCEAARIPVIWATEVLGSLVKKGVATRGEFTDAAMGARAECVMLNKGPYLEEGVRVLDDVLRRAERHIDKKTPQLPRLASWTAPLG